MKPELEIIIVDGMDSLVVLSIMTRMDELHRLVAHRPFPSPSILTRLVTELFKEMPQKQVYACVQHIKGYIAGCYVMDDVAKQNCHGN